MHDIFQHPASQPLLAFLPYLPQKLQAWAGRTLEDIASEFNAPGMDGPPSEAIRTCLMSMVRPVLGDDIAEAFGERLQYCPAMLAANHHGIDCFAEQVQAVHFFGLSSFLQSKQTKIGKSRHVKNITHTTYGAHAKRTPKHCTHVIPVLACSGVPLQSYSYPRGFLTARVEDIQSGIRLPLFPSSLQNTLVYKAPALTAENVLAAREKWDTSHLETWKLFTADTFINEHILQKEVLELPKLCDQFMKINASLCAERYPDYPHIAVIYLDLEELARNMLLHDLQNPVSIMYTILFNSEVRDKIVEKLAGSRACWTHSATQGHDLPRTGSNGSVFFWYINEKGQRCPLTFHRESGRNVPVLRYKDFRLPLTPEAISMALANKQIYSGLFTTFTSLHLEHGLRGYGGIYMVNYLPHMLNIVQSVFREFALKIQKYTSFMSLASVTFTVQIEERLSKNRVPAGALEFAALGGLRQNNMERLGKLFIEKILPLSIQEWSLEHLPKAQQTASLKQELLALSKEWRGIICPL